MLGVPIGQPEFFRDFLEVKTREQATLFQRIPWVQDTQAAFWLLLMCGSTRANFWLRSRRGLLNATTLLFGDASAQSWDHHQLLTKPRCWPHWSCCSQKKKMRDVVRHEGVSLLVSTSPTGVMNQLVLALSIPDHFDLSLGLALPEVTHEISSSSSAGNAQHAAAAILGLLRPPSTDAPFLALMMTRYASELCRQIEWQI